jgi:hypothetical protein
MKGMLIRVGAACLRLAGCDVTYLVSRRSGKQGRGFGRTLFASGSLTKSKKRASEVRVADNDAIFVRLETPISIRTNQKED